MKGLLLSGRHMQTRSSVTSFVRDAPSQSIPATLHCDASGRRALAGMRQQDLADVLAVPQSVVSKFESGERRLDVLELRDICLVLKTTLPEFVRRFERTID